MSQDVARLGARSNEFGLKRTNVSYIAPSSFIELISVSCPGSREVGSATSPTTSVPGVVSENVDRPTRGAAPLTGAATDGIAATARLAPATLTNARRDKPPHRRPRPEDATHVLPFVVWKRLYLTDRCLQ